MAYNTINPNFIGFQQAEMRIVEAAEKFEACVKVLGDMPGQDELYEALTDEIAPDCETLAELHDDDYGMNLFRENSSTARVAS